MRCLGRLPRLQIGSAFPCSVIFPINPLKGIIHAAKETPHITTHRRWTSPWCHADRRKSAYSDPTLDRFIEQDTYFRNAYTLSPICVSARQSFLSGLYPRNMGCTDFGTAMPSEVLTIPGHLSRYGYQTVGAGKMHFVGPDQMHGWHERVGRDIRLS